MKRDHTLQTQSIARPCWWTLLTLIQFPIVSCRRHWRANLMTAGAAFALLVAAANGEAASLEPGPQMCVARMNHYSLQMPDGRVALLGGHGTGFVSLDSMDLWSPTNNEFACVGLPFVYDSGALVRMADGRYLMAGGAADLGVAPGYASAQILDPASATVTTTGTTMVRPRMMCAGTQLTGGKVLIVGGWYDQDSATYGEIWLTTLFRPPVRSTHPVPCPGFIRPRMARRSSSAAWMPMAQA